MELEIAVVDFIVYVQDNDSYVPDFFQLERERVQSTSLTVHFNEAIDRKCHG